MHRLIVNFKNSINSVTMFVYLVNVILISLLYNNPLVSLGILITLILISTMTRREKIVPYLKFSSLIFLVTVLFNVIVNQRGHTVLWSAAFLTVTSESLLNGVILGISFVNLLWSFYLYDALIRVRTIFEVLSNFLKSIAIIFILTIKFIPQIIKIFNETQALSQFRAVVVKPAKGIQKIKQTMGMTEVVLNKAIANFMNVSDTLILKGYEQRQKNIGWLEFRKVDWSLLLIISGSIIFNIIMVVLKFGKVNFGSADLHLMFDKKIGLILLINCCLILLPLLTGGVNYLWWKFYSSKTTVSDTITAQNYR